MILATIEEFGDIDKKGFRWDLFSKAFCEKIKENTKGEISDILQADFSTSTVIEQVAS